MELFLFYFFLYFSFFFSFFFILQKRNFPSRISLVNVNIFAGKKLCYYANLIFWSLSSLVAEAGGSRVAATFKMERFVIIVNG